MDDDRHDITLAVNGVSYTVPYVLTVDGYPMASRCTTRSGCTGHTGIDFVGVKITAC